MWWNPWSCEDVSHLLGRCLMISGGLGPICKCRQWWTHFPSALCSSVPPWPHSWWVHLGNNFLVWLAVHCLSNFHRPSLPVALLLTIFCDFCPELKITYPASLINLINPIFENLSIFTIISFNTGKHCIVCLGLTCLC